MTAHLVPLSGSAPSLCTRAEAQKLTDLIRHHADALWTLLLEAHDRQAWRALGYGSFGDYVMTEFDMSRRHAYRVLDQGRVIRELEAASGVTHGSQVEVTEREARDIKPHLTEVTDAVRDAVRDAPDDKVAEVVNTVIAQERERIRQRQAEAEERAAFRDEIAADLPDDYDDQAEEQRAVLVMGLVRTVENLTTMPPVDDVLRQIPDYVAHDFDHVDDAVAWLADFAAAWKESR